jgi:hypothetical protein
VALAAVASLLVLRPAALPAAQRHLQRRRARQRSASASARGAARPAPGAAAGKASSRPPRPARPPPPRICLGPLASAWAPPAAARAHDPPGAPAAAPGPQPAPGRRSSRPHLVGEGLRVPAGDLPAPLQHLSLALHAVGAREAGAGPAAVLAGGEALAVELEAAALLAVARLGDAVGRGGRPASGAGTQYQGRRRGPSQQAGRAGAQHAPKLPRRALSNAALGTCGQGQAPRSSKLRCGAAPRTLGRRARLACRAPSLTARRRRWQKTGACPACPQRRRRPAPLVAGVPSCAWACRCPPAAAAAAPGRGPPPGAAPGLQAPP